MIWVLRWTFHMVITPTNTPIPGPAWKSQRGFESFINFRIFPNFSYILSPLLSFCCFFLLSIRVLDLYTLSISRSSSKLRTSRIEKGSLSLSISRSPLQIVSLFLSLSQSVFWDFFLKKIKIWDSIISMGGLNKFTQQGFLL